MDLYCQWVWFCHICCFVHSHAPLFLALWCAEKNGFWYCCAVMYCTNSVLFDVYWRQRADERLGDPPPKGACRSLQWSETGMEDPQEDPLAVHCFCVCSGSVLLGDLLGVSRSRERDLLSVLFINHRFLCVCSLCLVTFFVFILFCYNLMHVRCFGLVVNTCPPPLPFGCICFVVLVMRKGGESSWSGPWHLGCTSEVSFSMCTATGTSSYSPVGPSVF